MSAPQHRPYDNDGINAIYHLLFGDDPASFKAASKGDPGRFAPLFGSAFDEPALRDIEADGRVECRLRLLAAHRLRAEGKTPAPKRLLGIVIEVGMAGGLDTLAAYADGGVRYLNHTGKASIIDGDGALSDKVGALFTAAKPLIARIGPWDCSRLPPPREGRARVTLLANDGLYFGDGPMADLSADALAGPVMLAGAELLDATVKLSLAAQKKT